MDFNEQGQVSSGSHVTNNYNYTCPKKSSGWKIFFIVVFLLLFLFLGGCGALIAGCSALCNAASNVSENSFLKKKGIEVSIVRGEECNDTIAVVDVKGIITREKLNRVACSQRIVELIQYVADGIDDYKALIIDMDTPGGEVIAADEIYGALRKLKAAKPDLPIITCMHSMGASGGYYVAAGTDYIVANRMTFTGSIGVIMSSYNITGLMGKIGVTEQVFRSGNMKDMMSPTREMTENERIYMKQMIDSTFNEFAKIVAEGREAYKTAEDVKAAPFGDGRVLSGAEALQYKLVDELGDFDTAVAAAVKVAGIEGEPCIARLSLDTGFMESLFELKENIPLQGKLFPEKIAVMKAGHPYFLLPSTAL